MIRSGTASPLPAHSETSRQVVHMAMGGFALLLRWLPWWQAVALAAGALVFNLFLLPRIAATLYRPGDRERTLHGIVYYPLAVLVLLAAFPTRLDIVAAAWGILAMGDGIATLVGRRAGGARWSWNRDKTIAGSAAFALAGACAGVFLAWWCRDAATPAPPLAFIFVAPLLAAVVAALVETMPIRLDDNLSVAVAAGGVLAVCTVVISPAGVEALRQTLPLVPLAVAFNLLFAAAGYAARTVNVPGALIGALIGATVLVSRGWNGWALLFATFLAAAITSRTGLQRKLVLGIAEDRGGRRGPGNAIANTGVAAIAAGLAVIPGPHGPAAGWAFVAALVAGGSDTVASEIGKAWGRTTWSVTTWRTVPPGTSGAMSLEGTLAGIVSAFGLAWLAMALHLIPLAGVVAVAIAATMGSLLESFLGATLEGPGVLDNDTLNFINTATAAVVAAFAYGLFS